MDRRRVARLAEVLVASQMRSGRSTSTPSDFFGRPIALLVVDVGAFLAVLALASQAIAAIAGRDPALWTSVEPQLLAFLPLLVLGAVLLAGLLFELSTTSRFAASDAANWLPITPTEYVAASALAAAFFYSITAAFALGIAVAVTWFTGDLAGLLLAGFLIVLTLFLGGVLVEMLRASTQRITSVVSRRTGRATLVLRIGVFLVVVLAFQLVFNPLFLFALLESVSAAGPLAYAVPFLWPSRALLALASGNALAAAVLTAGSMGLAAILLAGAAWLRVRFWAPAAAELDLGSHSYGPAHPGLSAIGLSQGEAALVWKDLRGLVRRRELLPFLVIPLAITLVSLFSRASTGGRTDLGAGVLAAFTPALFALLVSATSIGQERRAIQLLYALPVAARGVFRAKSVSVLLPALAYSLLLWALVGALLAPSWRVAIGLLALMATVAVVTCFLGLAFATRYSDFQERPRPQFLRPAAMVSAMLLGVFLVFAIAIPFLLWLYSVSPDLALPLLSATIAALSLAVAYRAARSGADRLMRSLPL
ncbi:MAG: hypothetical protein L3K06_02040 [Thermoplasmata archaeon]|nr:hypothetical protein [Thermoplasmata archaeon]MCI4354128.1 hypothetical protein [Thermoplasmata archaeon]